jgi:adenine-specific DNA-methyltransferase
VHQRLRKRYASSARFLRYEHEIAYLLAKGDVTPPAQPIPDVIEFRYTGNKLHPTQKPTAALTPLISLFQPSARLMASCSTRLRVPAQHSLPPGSQHWNLSQSVRA